MRAVLIQQGSIGIEDEDAVISERDFLGPPRGFVAVVGALPVEAGLIVIGGNPLFDGLPGQLDGLEGADVEGQVANPRAGEVSQSHREPEPEGPYRRRREGSGEVRAVLQLGAGVWREKGAERGHS